MNEPTGTFEAAKRAADVKIGDIVLYSMDQGPHASEIRPAIVVNIFPANRTTPGQMENAPPTPLLNLQVFVDGRNDGFDSDETGTVWKTSKSFSPDKETGTWHLPQLSTTTGTGSAYQDQEQLSGNQSELVTPGSYNPAYSGSRGHIL